MPEILITRRGNRIVVRTEAFGLPGYPGDAVKDALHGVLRSAKNGAKRTAPVRTGQLKRNINHTKPRYYTATMHAAGSLGTHAYILPHPGYDNSKWVGHDYAPHVIQGTGRIGPKTAPYLFIPRIKVKPGISPYGTKRLSVRGQAPNPFMQVAVERAGKTLGRRL